LLPGFAMVLVLVFSGGCNRIVVYPVHGKVTFAGKPMAGGGSIAFVPLENQPGKTAGGIIGEDGTYELTTHHAGDGSMAGDFRVVITQAAEVEPERTPDGKAAVKPRVIPPAQRIPVIYADHYQSPLTAKVEAKDSNEINFELTSK
jgi:hypothetical protein